MKHILLQICCIFIATAALAQSQLPPILRDKQHVPVVGIVTSCQEAQITVASTNTVVTVVPDGTGIARTSRGLRTVVVRGSGGTVVNQVTVFTALRNYPQWQQVKVGDMMSVNMRNCYLMADTGTYRIVQWYQPPTNSTPRNVWQ